MRCAVTLAALAALVALTGCERAIRDQSRLKAIRSEANSLMAAHPVTARLSWVEIPRSQEPPIIATLQPYSVTVDYRGVEILMKPGLDGGWGYQVLRSKRRLPMPAECYSDLGEGVFWHGPC
jgi:hypothetical protein